MWPVAVSASAAVGGFAFVTVPPVWLSIAVALIVGVGAGYLRFAIWERRHPLLTPEEYVQRQRDSAWLN